MTISNHVPKFETAAMAIIAPIAMSGLALLAGSWTYNQFMHTEQHEYHGVEHAFDQLLYSTAPVAFVVALGMTAAACAGSYDYFSGTTHID
jgi:hypothetical protein